jgi:hypothetical protein
VFLLDVPDSLSHHHLLRERAQKPVAQRHTEDLPNLPLFGISHDV